VEKVHTLLLTSTRRWRSELGWGGADQADENRNRLKKKVLSIKLKGKRKVGWGALISRRIE